MTDKPILFSPAMVRALLDGRKTMTRRVLKPQPPSRANFLRMLAPDAWFCDGLHDKRDACEEHQYPVSCRFAAGDRLYVREAHYLTDDGEHPYAVLAVDQDAVAAHLAEIERLKQTHPSGAWKAHTRLRPGIHMPRWASRLTLIVTDVRVERVQEISRGDAMAEGCPFSNMADGPNPRDWFAELWDSINGPRSFGWDVNPWVSVTSFSVIKQNIDQVKP